MAMSTRDKDKESTADLLRRAVKKQVERKCLAVSGQGIDRHMMGLYLIAKENGMNIPEFFTDKVGNLES